MTHLSEVLARIQIEYAEMPELKLTVSQVRRLWHLDAAICAAALGALVEANFLAQTPDGMFRRRGAWPSISGIGQPNRSAAADNAVRRNDGSVAA